VDHDVGIRVADEACDAARIFERQFMGDEFRYRPSSACRARLRL
jgi:hypothetical protein